MIRELILSPAEREQLARVLNSDPKPYRRERAAALLQVAQGEIALHVARRGLLRPRDPDTVYAWLDRFQAEGLAGLTIRPGRGRKSAFPPWGSPAGRAPGRPGPPRPA
jgi:hypothetical protein